MMKLFNTLILAILLSAGCKEDKMGPMGGSSAQPSPITKATVDNLPGGARISYVLPASGNLLYIKAVYTIKDNVVKEVKASYYDNFVMIEGFNDTDVHKVQLYAVSRNELVSAPFEVEIKPLTSPVEMAFATLHMEETFGGVYISLENQPEANLAIVLMTTDSTGAYVEADTYFTKAPKAGFSARGYKTEERSFAVFIRDRWLNYSDTLYAKLTPWFEEKVPKPFVLVKLPGDNTENHGSWTIGKLWNDVVNSDADAFHTKPGSGLPATLTFSLSTNSDKKFVLSRFKWYHRPGAQLTYIGADPKTWEVWGSVDPNPSGAFDDSWFKLMDCESIKPSGPDATVTAEDRLYANRDGEDFTFPPGLPPVKYVRLKMKTSWSGLDYWFCSEITFWGQRVP